MANRVILESGTASGREPTSQVELRSYLTEYLTAAGISLGAEDETSFSMRLLHFRRTFVEKMFAIHSKVELLKAESRPLGGYARHYYDLFQLSQQPEVLAMLQAEEYSLIQQDYDTISRTHFPKSYFFPDEMSFAKSDAIFPPQELESVLRAGIRAAMQSSMLRPVSFMVRITGPLRRNKVAPVTVALFLHPSRLQHRVARQR